MYDTETIFWAENATHRITVTVAPDDATFADIEPEVTVRHVDREEYIAVNVRAVVQAKCGACDTWHAVGEDSIGYVVDTPDTATWREVACNALRAAGLDLKTFDFGV